MISPHRRPLGLLSVPAWLLCAAAGAQTLPPQPQPPLTPPLPQAPGDHTRLPQRPAGALPPEVARPADDIRLDITGFELVGGSPALHEAAARLTAPFTGKGRSYEDLMSAVAAVTRFLQADLGHYLGYAYLPAQRPANGRVRIQVLDGRLDRVVLQWPEGGADAMPLRRSVVEAILAQLQPGGVLLVSDVERVVFLVNDLRGIRARFEFREGREWGTAELVVKAEPEDRFAGKLDLDSDGSRYSGRVRLGAQALWGNPLGLGDALTLSAQGSVTGGQGLALLGYTLPVGPTGVKLGASLSSFRYRYDKDLLPQDVRGRATAATAYALWPAIRSRNLNLFTLVSLERKRFSDAQAEGDALEVRKHTDELRLGASGDWRDGALTGGVNTYELALHSGRVHYDLHAPAASDDDARFSKLAFGLSRLQNVVTNRALLYVNLRGQRASANLDSTQQFRLGGADGVRAYAPGEAAGDHGWLLSMEMRLLPPTQWLPASFERYAREIVASVFYDMGQVSYRKDASQRPADFVNRSRLAGAGVGVVWERPGQFNARLYAAWATQGKATGDPQQQRPRLYALLSKPF